MFERPIDQWKIDYDTCASMFYLESYWMLFSWRTFECNDGLNPMFIDWIVRSFAKVPSSVYFFFSLLAINRNQSIIRRIRGWGNFTRVSIRWKCIQDGTENSIEYEKTELCSNVIFVVFLFLLDKTFTMAIGKNKRLTKGGKKGGKKKV